MIEQCHVSLSSTNIIRTAVAVAIAATAKVSHINSIPYNVNQMNEILKKKRDKEGRTSKYTQK